MSKILVPFKLWEAALECVADNDIRHYLNGIHLNKFSIESTNGHVAYKARVSKELLPKIDDKDPESWPNVIIQPTTDKPKASTLNKTYILEISIQENYVTIKYLNSVFQEIGVQSGKVIDGKYPDFNKIKPKKSKLSGTFDVGFNAHYLSIPSKILKREKFGHIKMSNYDAHSSCRIDIIRGGTIEEYLFLMPVRL